MPKIILITGAAGGSGRTSVTANLAALFADSYQQRVLCLALRRTSDLRYWFQWPVRPDDLVRTARPVPAPAPKGQRTELAWLDPRESPPGDEDCFCTAPLRTVLTLATLKQTPQHDYVLIDAEKGFDPLVAQACAIADLVLLVGGLNLYEAKSLASLVGEIRRVTNQSLTKPTPIRSVLNQRWSPEPVAVADSTPPASESEPPADFFARAYTQAGLPPLCAAQIRADEDYQAALADGRPVLRVRPRSQTAQDYQDLATELLTLL